MSHKPPSPAVAANMTPEQKSAVGMLYAAASMARQSLAGQIKREKAKSRLSYFKLLDGELERAIAAAERSGLKQPAKSST